MKRCVFLMGTTIVALVATAFCSFHQPPAARADEEKAITIPPERIYMTSEQRGQNRNWGGALEKCQQQYDELEIGRFGVGESNLFVVNADSLSDAIVGTWLVHRVGFGVDAQIKPDQEKVRHNTWLAVCLGCSTSAPPMWLAHSVEIKGNTIRFSYSVAKPTVRGLNEHKYFYWVDLGTLKAGTYSLQLFEVDEKETTLTRRVKVAAKK